MEKYADLVGIAAETRSAHFRLLSLQVNKDRTDDAVRFERGVTLTDTEVSMLGACAG